MSENLGTGVSRYLNANDKSFLGVVWQELKPPLDSELNLVADISNNLNLNRFRSTTPSGWVTYKSGFANALGTSSKGLFSSFEQNCLTLGKQTSAKTASTIRVDEMEHAIVNGWDIFLGNIATDKTYLKIALGSAPVNIPANNYEYKFVFLEVWKQLLDPTTGAGLYDLGGGDYAVYPYGNTQWYDPSLLTSNDIIDPAVTIETTKRVQLQYRIRVESVSYSSVLAEDPFSDTSVYAQGGQASPVGGYNFSKSGTAILNNIETDSGLWISGSGSNPDQTALGTTDGFVYAIPMAVVYRRNTTAYNVVSNSHGNATVLGASFTQNVIDNAVYDRPDRLSNDWVFETDVIDFRKQIFVSGHLPKGLLEENLDLLMSGDLNTAIKQGDGNGSPLNLVGNKILQVDELASYDNPGRTSIVSDPPDGVRRNWMDEATSELHAVRFASGTSKTAKQNVFSYNGLTLSGTGQITINTSSLPSSVTVNNVEIYSETTLGAGTLEATVGASFTISGEGTSIVTITRSIAWSGNFFVKFTLDYPAGAGSVPYLFEEVLDVHYQPTQVSSFSRIAFAEYEAPFHQTKDFYLNLPSASNSFEQDPDVEVIDYTSADSALLRDVGVDANLNSVGFPFENDTSVGMPRRLRGCFRQLKIDTTIPSSPGNTLVIPISYNNYTLIGVSNVIRKDNGAILTISNVTNTSGNLTITFSSSHANVDVYAFVDTNVKGMTYGGKRRSILGFGQMQSVTRIAQAGDISLGVFKYRVYLDETVICLPHILKSGSSYGYTAQVFVNGTTVNNAKFESGFDWWNTSAETPFPYVDVIISSGVSVGNTVNFWVGTTYSLSTTDGINIYHKRKFFQGSSVAETVLIDSMSDGILSTKSTTGLSIAFGTSDSSAATFNGVTGELLTPSGVSSKAQSVDLFSVENIFNYDPIIPRILEEADLPSTSDLTSLTDDMKFYSFYGDSVAMGGGSMTPDVPEHLSHYWLSGASHTGFLRVKEYIPCSLSNTKASKTLKEGMVVTVDLSGEPNIQATISNRTLNNLNEGYLFGRYNIYPEFNEILEPYFSSPTPYKDTVSPYASGPYLAGIPFLGINETGEVALYIFGNVSTTTGQADFSATYPLEDGYFGIKVNTTGESWNFIKKYKIKGNPIVKTAIYRN